MERLNLKKKLIETTLYPKLSTYKVKFIFPYCQVIQYQIIHPKPKLIWFSKNLEFEILFWLIFLKDDIIQIMKFAQVFDKT